MGALTGLLVVFVSPVMVSLPGAWAAGPCQPVHLEQVDRADRLLRGESSQGRMTLRVYKRGTATLKMKFWSRGRSEFLVQLVAPSRLRGTATLKSGENLWSYLPRLDRVMRLGPSMMGASWMGSHLTNDDLVKETELRRHYDCVSAEAQGEHLLVSLTPRPQAPVVWGRVEMKLRTQGSLPVRTRYYDERGTLRRTLRFSDVRTVGGRTVPTRLVVQPADSASERTVVTYERLRFDLPIADRTFTLQGLKR